MWSSHWNEAHTGEGNLFLSFPTCGTTFHTLFNLILLSRSSRQPFTNISGHPPSKTVIFSAPVKPTPPLKKSLLMYPSCPLIAFSPNTHRYLHPWFVRFGLHSTSTLLMAFPFYVVSCSVMCPSSSNEPRPCIKIYGQYPWVLTW